MLQLLAVPLYCFLLHNHIVFFPLLLFPLSLYPLEFFHFKLIHSLLAVILILIVPFLPFFSLSAADFGVSAQITATLAKRKSFIGTPYWLVLLFFTFLFIMNAAKGQVL